MKYLTAGILVGLLLVTAVSPCWGDSVLAGRIYSLQGSVEFSRDGGKQWASAAQSQDLYQEDIIRTGPLSRAAVLLADQSLLKMDERSTIKLTEVSVSTKISLGALVRAVGTKVEQSRYQIFGGRFWFQTTAKLSVETPSAILGIRGTEFGLVVKQEGETVLAMIEGLAEMGNPYGAILVSTGEQGVARPGMAPFKTILVNPEDAVQWSLFYPATVSFRDYFFISPDPTKLASLLEKVNEDLKSRPHELSLWLLRGRLYHDLRDWVQARAAFEHVHKSGLMNAEVFEGLGWIELQEGNLDRAISFLDRVETQTEMSALGLTLALFQKDQAVESLSLLEKSLSSMGRKPKLLVMSALLKLHFGKAGEALADLKEADGLDRSGLGLGLMSNIYLVLNAKEKALEAAEEAIRLNPWSSTVHVDLAWVRQSYFDLPGAMDASRIAIELDARNVRALITYSQLLFGSGYLEQAQEITEKALLINPKEPLTYTLRGYLFLARRETERAVEEFQRALRLDSTQAQPHLGLGIAYMRQRALRQAFQEMLVAILLEPRVSLNYSYLGKALHQIKDFEGALKALQRAKALDPRDPTPFLYSGIVNTDLDRVAQGIWDLEKSAELNDNRAVYRSRSLLDQDRAVKNVDLARTYSSLGLSAMARNRAMRSLKDDPNNSSAHLFWAKVLLGENDRTAAASSEILKALLLEPANQNSFNTFNQYTSMFEQPEISGSPEVQIGNHATRRYIGDFWGSWNNLAVRELLQSSATDGYKTNTFDRSWLNYTTAKYEFGLNQDILLRCEYNKGKTGDLSQNSDAFAREDLDDTIDSNWTNVAFGYHLRTSPKSDLFFILLWDQVESINQDGPLSEVNLSPDLFYEYRKVYERLAFDQSFWHMAAAHQLRLGEHRLLYGLEYFTGSSRVEDASQDQLSIPSLPFIEPVLVDNPTTRNSIDPRYFTVFVQDSWQIHPRLTLEGGLYYEQTKDGTTIPVFSSREYEVNRLSPRVGFIFIPNSENTLRIGYARYLQSAFISPERLGPTDIAGFTIGQNALSSSIHEDLSFAWERQVNPQTFFRIEMFTRERIEQLEDPFTETFCRKKRHFYGGTFEWNLMFWKYFGINPGYKYIRNKEEEFEHSFAGNPKRWRDDHELHLGLHFVHPSGWKASIDTYYIKQILNHFDMEDPKPFWQTDLSVEKSFLEKHLTFGCNVENVFDQKYHLLREELTIEQHQPSLNVLFFIRYNF